MWGEDSSPLELRVVPPFWSSWWIRLGGVLAFVVVVGGLVRRRETAARRKRVASDEFSRRLIESQEHERLRLAGELHDGIGQDLMIVRNRALLALRVVDPGAGVREQLDYISDVVSGSLESIRELVHNLTPHQLRHLGLSSALRAMAEAIAKTSEIELDIRIEAIDQLLPEESEIALYRIVQEALNNVVRHSGAQTATLDVRRHGDAVSVTVRDRGRGFRSDRNGGGNGQGGFGLSGMEERARILGGSLRVRSVPGRGTQIELSVPVVAAAVR
jgi:signal transduction histidine kinase